ncbi:hypothetical protein FIBSPDRAFT_967108 [Athelia psychrophila]|uniref:Uncharacterized protein n=1 Tax=Athelia psychrophila TaxID=1759441 RepID=A0A167W2N9_9AGAM|nr:hypothetical protein FIBSPDRAFT_967108 [Fibularhizoctonia sp. CBS 109695]
MLHEVYHPPQLFQLTLQAMATMFLPTHSKLLRQSLPPQDGPDLSLDPLATTWRHFLFLLTRSTHRPQKQSTPKHPAKSQPPHPTALPLTVKEPAPDPQRSLPQLIPSKFQCPATIGQTLVLNFIVAQVHSASPFSANPPDSPAESYASDEDVPRLNFPHPPSVIHQNSANASVDGKSQPVG